jgi:hypothetical protein
MRRASSPSCWIRTTPSNYEHHVVMGEGYELMMVFEHQGRGVTHFRLFLMLVRAGFGFNLVSGSESTCSMIPFA